MIIIITLILLLATIQQTFTLPPNSTKNDFCLPVPAHICDKSYCQPVDINDLIEFGHLDLKLYTSTVVPKQWARFCPLRYNTAVTESYDGSLQLAVTYILNSGSYCNETETSPKLYIGKPDSKTGLLTSFAVEFDGEQYDVCFPYFEPGKAAVLVYCKIHPAPPYGEACASIQAWEVAEGNCGRSKFLQFLQELGIDYVQKTCDSV